jgi:hypothetical protein
MFRECVRPFNGYGAGPGCLPGNWMYRVVYWAGLTLFVVWSVFSAYSAITGL